MMAKTQEPDTAPRADKWYRLKLGPTISEQNSSRFYTLRCKSFTLSLSLFVFSQSLVLLSMLFLRCLMVMPN
jgi:hypothetical protein